MLSISSLFLKFISLVLSLSEMQSFPPPLSAELERELFQRARGGDCSARAKLIEHNMRLVSHIVKKYYTSFPDTDELLSVGSLGLIKAIDSYRCDAGTRFATYGAKCVQNEILMFFRSRKKLSYEVSLNDTIDVDRDGNPLTYLDIISEPERLTEDIELKTHVERLRELIDAVLDAREREIATLRYGLKGYEPLTQREVARHLGISRSYVSRIEKRALEKLRAAFGDTVPSFDD